MSGSEWLVTIGGIAAIAWVNWYFFLAQRTSTSAEAPSAPAAEDGSAKD